MTVYQILLVRFLRIVFPTFDQRAKEAGLLVATADWKFWFGGMQGLVPSGQHRDRDHETLYGSRRAVEATLRALIVETGLVTGLDGVQGNGRLHLLASSLRLLTNVFHYRYNRVCERHRHRIQSVGGQ